MEPEDGRKSAAVLLDESELDGSMGEGVTEYFDRIAE
jgi:hypothetical protein